MEEGTTAPSMSGTSTSASTSSTPNRIASRSRNAPVQPPPTRTTRIQQLLLTSSPSTSAGSMEQLERRLLNLEEQYSSIRTSIEEIQELLTKLAQDSFTIKGSPYEAALNEELSRGFCLSHRHEIPSDKLQEIVVKVLRHDRHDTHKIKCAVTYAKAKLSKFRAEERRKVAGISPYQQCRTMSTPQLADAIMHSMKAPKDVKDTYIKHLAILRKYIRDGGAIQNLYEGFRTWIAGCEHDLDWPAIMEEDATCMMPSSTGATTSCSAIRGSAEVSKSDDG